MEEKNIYSIMSDLIKSEFYNGNFILKFFYSKQKKIDLQNNLVICERIDVNEVENQSEVSFQITIVDTLDNIDNTYQQVRNILNQFENEEFFIKSITKGKCIEKTGFNQIIFKFTIKESIDESQIPITMNFVSPDNSFTPIQNLNQKNEKI